MWYRLDLLLDTKWWRGLRCDTNVAEEETCIGIVSGLYQRFSLYYQVDIFLFLSLIQRYKPNEQNITKLALGFTANAEYLRRKAKIQKISTEIRRGKKEDSLYITAQKNCTSTMQPKIIDKVLNTVQWGNREMPLAASFTAGREWSLVLGNSQTFTFFKRKFVISFLLK